MSKGLLRELLGESIGTFVLVFIGCGAVGAAVILGWLDALWQVALMWTIGVVLGIKAADPFSPAHLNPAVTLSMCIAKGHSWRRLFPYSLAQLVGAVVAAIVLLLLFQDSIEAVEKQLLGTDADLYSFVGPMRSAETAQMFGEFFPNLGYIDKLEITWPLAMLAEATGAFLLITGIFILTERIHTLTWWTALKIGLLVGLIIILIAPATQCGINPARDLGPRLVAYLSGWGENALPSPAHGAISVYVLAPLIGAVAASLLYRRNRVSLH